jgi:hypothetical protein
MTQSAQGVYSLCVFCGIICAYLAKKKERSPWAWGALGFFIIGPIAYALIFIIIGAVAGIYYR